MLTVTIEMRHAPFFGWIHDLSARDPTTIWNLFGLIPWDPATRPLIGGILDGHAAPRRPGRSLYGFTMWLTHVDEPAGAATRPSSRSSSFMPMIFTFIMAPFAVGPADLLDLVQRADRSSSST